MIDPNYLPPEWNLTINEFEKDRQFHWAYWFGLKKEIVPPYPDPLGTLGTIYADNDLCPDWPPRAGPASSVPWGIRGVCDITCPTKWPDQVPAPEGVCPEGKSIILGGFVVGPGFHKFYYHQQGLTEALLKMHHAAKTCIENIFPEFPKVLEWKLHNFIQPFRQHIGLWPGGPLDLKVPTVKGLYLTGTHVKPGYGDAGNVAKLAMDTVEIVLKEHRKS